MYDYDLVEYSIRMANEKYGGTPVELYDCPCCGNNSWYRRWGIDQVYASEWNPGEYIEFTCSKCGYSYEEGC